MCHVGYFGTPRMALVDTITLRQTFITIRFYANLTQPAVMYYILEHINDFQSIAYGGHVVFFK